MSVGPFGIGKGLSAEPAEVAIALETNHVVAALVLLYVHSTTGTFLGPELEILLESRVMFFYGFLVGHARDPLMEGYFTVGAVSFLAHGTGHRVVFQINTASCALAMS